MNGIVAKGIDIASFQGPNIDFAKVKESGYSFVIIKAGEGVQEMATFKTKAGYRYVQGAEAAGLDWGAYWYSVATTVQEVKAEAHAFLKALDGLRPTYPVILDWEHPPVVGGAYKGATYAGMPPSGQMEMIETFLDILEGADYYAMLYSTVSVLRGLRAACRGRMAKYALWVAAPDVEKPGVEGGIWQYSWDGRVPGIANKTDLNYAYEDYPAIIQAAGLNGWDKPSMPEVETVSRAEYDALQAKYDALAGHCGGLEYDLLDILKKHGIVKG